MGNSTSETEFAEEFLPEKQLEAPNTRLIERDIAMIFKMETLRTGVAYENEHQECVQILRRLDNRASEIHSQCVPDRGEDCDVRNGYAHGDLNQGP